MQTFRVTFLDEYKHIGRFSNLHYCTFNDTYLDILEFQQQQQQKNQHKNILFQEDSLNSPWDPGKTKRLLLKFEF